MPSATVGRFMRARCDILRIPTVSGGKSTDAVSHLSEVRCTPLVPLNNEVALRNGIDAPGSSKVTYIDSDLDVRAGDVCVVDGKHYPIRTAGRYDMALHAYALLELVLAEPKTERR